MGGGSLLLQKRNADPSVGEAVAGAAEGLIAAGLSLRWITGKGWTQWAPQQTETHKSTIITKGGHKHCIHIDIRHTTLNIYLNTQVLLEMGYVHSCTFRHGNFPCHIAIKAKPCACIHNHQHTHTHHPQDRLCVDMSQKQW